MLSDLTDDQRLLQDTISTLLSDSDASDADAWDALLSVGVTTLPFDAEEGGFGGGVPELAIVARELGRIRQSTPFLASVVVASDLLKRRLTGGQRELYLSAVIEGRAIATLADTESGFSVGEEQVSTTASLEGDHYVLDGVKTMVSAGAKADIFIVTAKVAGETEPALFLVERSAQGLRVAPYLRSDGTFDAQLSLNGVSVPSTNLLRDVGGHALKRARSLGLALLCSEAYGAMEKIQQETLEYLRTRRQFGSPIGANQALQHRAVDMFVEVQQARSMADYALACVDSAGTEAHLGPIAAKTFLNKAARIVGETAVQLNGAIGMTIESKVGRLFQRLTTFQAMPPDGNLGLATLLAAETSVLEAFRNE